jgi:hypothetical protein
MPNFGERFAAEIKAEGKHLRLFSEFTVTGALALVWDIKAKQEMLHEILPPRHGRLSRRRRTRPRRL